MRSLLKLFYEKPYLAWYTKDVKKISSKSMLEHILNYGDWEDYMHAEEALGIRETKKLFNDLKDQPRSNLRRKTICYFDKYFQKYA
jgi:hypothetical protein